MHVGPRTNQNSIEDLHVLFTPNVYKGDGTETRLNSCLQESGAGSIEITRRESQSGGDIFL